MASPALYLDEDVNPRLAIILRKRGFDVLTTAEADMLGQSDPEQLAFAAAQNRTVLTHNVRDYVMLAQRYAEIGQSHAGIIVADQVPLKSLLNRILKLLSTQTASDMIVRFERLSDYA